MHEVSDPLAEASTSSDLTSPKSPTLTPSPTSRQVLRLDVAVDDLDPLPCRRGCGRPGSGGRSPGPPAASPRSAPAGGSRLRPTRSLRGGGSMRVRSASSIPTTRKPQACQAPKRASRLAWRTWRISSSEWSWSDSSFLPRRVNFNATAKSPGPTAFQTSPVPPRPEPADQEVSGHRFHPGLQVEASVLEDAVGVPEGRGKARHVRILPRARRPRPATRRGPRSELSTEYLAHSAPNSLPCERGPPDHHPGAGCQMRGASRKSTTANLMTLRQIIH